MKSTKQKLVVVGIVTAVIGVAGAIIYKFFKDNKDEFLDEDDSLDEDEENLFTLFDEDDDIFDDEEDIDTEEESILDEE